MWPTTHCPARHYLSTSPSLHSLHSHCLPDLPLNTVYSLLLGVVVDTCGDILSPMLKAGRMPYILEGEVDIRQILSNLYPPLRGGRLPLNPADILDRWNPATPADSAGTFLEAGGGYALPLDVHLHARHCLHTPCCNLPHRRHFHYLTHQ